MSISRTFLLCSIALLSIAAKVGADERDNKMIFENADGLFSRSVAGGKVEKLSDTAHYQETTRNGAGVYVLQHWDDTKVWLTVLSCNKSGSLIATRTIADKQLSEITAIEWVDSLPDGRLFIECHVSPVLCVGVVIDVDRGEPLILVGDGFTWSASGRHIAYFVDAPQDTPPNAAGKSVQVWLDGKKVRDVSADEFAGLSWNAAGTTLTARLFKSGKTERHIVVAVAGNASVAEGK